MAKSSYTFYPDILFIVMAAMFLNCHVFRDNFQSRYPKCENDSGQFWDKLGYNSLHQKHFDKLAPTAC